jgi:hypothetical protein
MAERELDNLKKAIHGLQQTVDAFPRKYPWIFDPFQNLLYSFLRGVAYSLGLIVAVVLIVPFLVAIFRQVDWVPLIGDFLSNIASRMEEVQRLGVR